MLHNAIRLTLWYHKHFTQDSSDEICSGLPQGEYLVPDPEDCHKFYSCVVDGFGNFVAEHFTCPVTLAFEESLKRQQFKKQTRTQRDILVSTMVCVFRQANRCSAHNFLRLKVFFHQREEKVHKKGENKCFKGAYQYKGVTPKCWKTPKSWSTPRENIFFILFFKLTAVLCINPQISPNYIDVQISIQIWDQEMLVWHQETRSLKTDKCSVK